MEKLIETLMRRDEITREEAIQQINEFKEVVDELLEVGVDSIEIEEEFSSSFGLEPDYLLEMMMGF